MKKNPRRRAVAAKSARFSARHPAGFAERLEARRLLAATLDAELGILTITGGDEKNIIQIQVVDSADANTPATSFAVLESTTTAASPPLSFPTQQQVLDFIDSGGTPVVTNFSLGAVREVRILSGGGDDLIILGQKLPVPAFIDSGSGNDSISAGIGDDTITGNTGNDYVFGHDGDDDVSGGVGSDEVLGGDGFDVVDFKGRTGNLTITFNNSIGDGETGENDNIRTDVEGVIGGSGNDLIDASSHPSGVMLDGAAGNDTLIGSNSADVLIGGSGSDSLVGNGGSDAFFAEDGEADTVVGGSGDGDLAMIDPIGGSPADTVSDVAFVLADQDGGADPAVAAGGTATLNNGVLTVTGTSNADLIQLVLSQDGQSLFVIERQDRNGADDTFVSEFTLADITSVVASLGGGDDIFHGGGTVLPITANGGDGTDILIGGAGNDALNGGNGSDFLFGRGGNDLLDGGLGGDYISGGAGTDTATYAGRDGDVLVGIGQIPDDGERGEGDNVQLDIEAIIGGNGNDRLNTQGTSGVTFTGGPGRDIMTGGVGNDTFFAEDDEEDTVRGGAGTDVLGSSDDFDDVDLQNA